MRALLKEGVNSPACCPAMWGLLGRVYALEGEDESAKEALLKQVRSLTQATALCWLPPQRVAHLASFNNQVNHEWHPHTVQILTSCLSPVDE